MIDFLPQAGGRVSATVLTVLAMLGASGASACPGGLPTALQGGPIGEKVRVNGLQMSIRQVQSKDKREEMLDAAEKQWKAEGFTPRRSVNGGWQVLTALSPVCLATLQLADRGGAFGYFARSIKDPTPPLALAAHAPLPPNATVTSSVASDDDGRKGLVLTMTSPSSMADLQKFFGTQLYQAKWSAPRSHTVQTKGGGPGTMFMTAQRQREQIEIVFWPARTTQVVMTISEAL